MNAIGAEAPAAAALLVVADVAAVRWRTQRLVGAGDATGRASGAAGESWATRAAEVDGAREATLADAPRALVEAARPARLRVANAAGRAFAAALAEAAVAAWGVAPEFVTPRASAAGLECDAWAEVGVDRWLAMIGARQRSGGRALVVVTCGAAVAVDVVDADGRHRRGCVVPGVRAMREALYARTGSLASLAALAPPAVAGGFGVNTAGAIEAGARGALAALVARAAGPPGGAGAAHVYVTGSGAREAAAWLAPAGELAPDLALEGLARLGADERAR